MSYTIYAVKAEQDDGSRIGDADVAAKWMPAHDRQGGHTLITWSERSPRWQVGRLRTRSVAFRIYNLLR